MPPNTLRVLVVDTQPVVRKGVAHMLARMQEGVVVLEAGDAAEALLHLVEFNPSLVISEVSLPGRSGIDLVKQLAKDNPELPILVFTGQDESVYAERSLRAGAVGFVAKSAHEAAFLEAVRRVLDGQVYVSSSVRQYILGGMAGARAQVDPVAHLSERELAVFELAGQGRTRSEIAQALRLSPKTIGSYQARIKSKLHLDSSAQLVRLAVQWVQANP